ncbi:Metallo-beta-lactamase superfamily [Micractinium conductrix]|uniref:Metallo-beta-lactamase superfamily n=1 Tax=Micractinium conductrix TaxID=554055 RepID=A0A2P6VEW6_9CHLO|nr:Metallo-beta-lactamase superfamily [Micractinium conductrix]|eukprot:PSC72632.1 Metallo-beta-lactamase superfamily [Micractinium conductrix]
MDPQRDWREVEWLRVTVLVDNITDMLSEPPAAAGAGAGAACSYTSEKHRHVAAVRSGAAPCLDFRKGLLAAHGLSLLLTAQPAGGGSPRTLLFDAGPDALVLRTNFERMGVDAAAIEAVVLSHWHMDHSGGLPAAAQMIAKAHTATAWASVHGPPPPAVIDVHPRRPARRGALLPDGSAVPFNADPKLSELRITGATVVEEHAEPHTLCGGCFYVSGAIPRQTSYEGGNPGNATQWEEGGAWQADPLVEDERFLAVRVRGRGPVVLSACSHAGVVNVLRAASLAAGGDAPHAVIGGLHLSTPDCVDRIQDTVDDIKAMAPALVVAGHCTGWRAQAALVAALPDRCMPGTVGAIYEFREPVEEREGGAPA